MCCKIPLKITMVNGIFLKITVTDYLGKYKFKSVKDIVLEQFHQDVNPQISDYFLPLKNNSPILFKLMWEY